MSAAGSVTVVEVGPRDGLQNEKGFVPTAVKVAFVEALAGAGLPVVETTAFVSPRAIPQLADSAEVFSRVTKRAGTRYPVLVPNDKGMARALAAGAREVSLFTAATDTFNLRNINATIEESFARFAPVLERAKAEGLRVRGYVSTAFGCPYEGRVDPARAVRVALRLFEAGCEEVSLGDTIGVAVPVAGRRRRGPPPRGRGPGRQARSPHARHARHGARERRRGAAARGSGSSTPRRGASAGCPYAPGAAGNLATEDLLYLLHGMGFETGVDLARVAGATRDLAEATGRAPVSRVFAALHAAPARPSAAPAR